ncbi:MAG TPA: N-acetyl-gamma-glutamyl-phosphate reductase [Firmicutes bacterium]|nr:N-acetyl-gamma-glutamyl-phosphate reductase [Bacillota bacterium]
MIKAAVLGATGYTGLELVRLLHTHPEAEIVFLSSESYAGQKLSAVHPQFCPQIDLQLQYLNADQIPVDADIVFCALPHGQSAPVVPDLLKRGFRVIDLSADFRLKNAALYPRWYKREHPCPEKLPDAVYGLPELYSEPIRDASLLANPGCFPTGILLALAPLLKEKVVDPGGIVIDAKTGVSGAGRSPQQAFHFPECSDNFKAYRVAEHQHTPEIEQELGRFSGGKVQVTFVPHLVPMIRGILSTIYAYPAGEGEENKLASLYKNFYSRSYFIRYLERPALPETRFVRGSNFCDLACRFDPRTGRLIIVAAIDNLVKGASGQAVQNMNIMFGLPEETGLNQVPF